MIERRLLNHVGILQISEVEIDLDSIPLKFAIPNNDALENACPLKHGYFGIF